MTTETLSAEARFEELSKQVRFLVEEAEERRRMRQAIGELTGDLSPIAAQGLESVTRAMSQVESRGYTDFARSGLGVVDRIVTSFDTDDVEALGDNIVLILETMKEMTQPEVMSLLRSTLQRVHEAEEPPEPPSLMSLLGQMREPEVRRGLSRLLVFLRSLGGVQITNERKGKATHR